MTQPNDYWTYVNDEAFLGNYNVYQRKYKKEPRESDKVILRIVNGMAQRGERAKTMRLLDIGCSTGNLLFHLRRAFPQFELVGGELAESSLDDCRKDPDLAGITFQRLDILDLPRGEFDFVVVNAVLYMMTDDQFITALGNIRDALVPGGAIVVFDFFHPFEQRISMVEVSDSHPDGLPINLRPFSIVKNWLTRHGFNEIDFRSFTLPIDLPKLNEPGLPTYTVATADGLKLPFRGTLFQPWCHLVAVRP